MGKGLTTKERRDKKIAYRKFKKDEHDMVNLFGSFGVEQKEGGAMVDAALLSVSRLANEAAEVVEKLNRLEL